MMGDDGCSFLAAYRRANGSSASACSKGQQPHSICYSSVVVSFFLWYVCPTFCLPVCLSIAHHGGEHDQAITFCKYHYLPLFIYKDTYDIAKVTDLLRSMAAATSLRVTGVGVLTVSDVSGVDSDDVAATP